MGKCGPSDLFDRLVQHLDVLADLFTLNIFIANKIHDKWVRPQVLTTLVTTLPQRTRVKDVKRRSVGHGEDMVISL